MIFKNLTFDGISLKEYGVYISGEAVFDSPTREVEMITIPGRNGSFALDKGRFNNITVTYPAGIYATSETEFAEKVSTLRNLLASRKGYCRLTDEYNPDEFRLGVYKAGLELDPTHYNEAGRFELSFDCKPQRFLFSGEEVFTLGEWGQTETKSGTIVSFEGDETTAIKSLTAQIVPKQSGSGDPSPSNVRPISGYTDVNVTRCGKTILPKMTAGTYSANGGTIVVDNDGVAHLSGTTTASGNVAIIPLETPITITQDMVDRGLYYHLRNSAVVANLEPTLENNSAVRATGYAFSPANRISPQLGAGAVGKTITRIRFYVASGVTLSGTYAPSLEFTNEVTEYEPYQGTSYPISLGQTVYGGTLDVISGELTIDRAGVDMGTLAWTKSGTIFNATFSGLKYVNADVVVNAICPSYKAVSKNTSGSTTNDGIFRCDNSASILYFRNSAIATASDFKNSVNGQICVYELENPTTIQLTPTQVTSLLGANNIWADSGDVTVEIGQNPYILFNPTLFEACPLIEFNASGSGEINIGSRQIKVLNSYIGNIPLNLSANDNEVTIVNSSSFNSGDIIKFNGVSINIEYASNGQSWMPYVTARDGLNGTEYLSREGGWGITPKSTEMTFTAGTSSTVTQSLDVKVVRQHTTPATEETQTFTLSVAYDGTDKFTVTWTIPTYTVYPTYRTTDRSNYVGSVNSTKSSLEDVDIYVDLDIGEAYSVDSSDNVVSLNNFVNLGGELPTLEPGATEITTDSSISNVKVTPRWWKV